MAKRFFQTSNGKKGGELKGKAHYDSNGKPLGGIKAVVTDQGGTPVELEAFEVIVNKKTVQSDKVLTVKGTPKQILSTLNQMDGNGVAIGETEAKILAKYKKGGQIPREKHKLYLGEEGGMGVSSKSVFETAVELEKGGIDNETIRSLTGWFRNPHDKLWRYEISDKEMEIICTFTDKEIDHLKTKNNYIQRHLKDVIKHEELFKAYPRIKYLKVLFVDSNNSDEALLDITDNGEIFIICNLKYERAFSNNRAVAEELGEREISDNRRSGEERKAKRYNTLHFRKVITHELQHAIQINEGLAEGGNPNFELEKLKSESGTLHNLTEKEQEYIATQRYLNKAGEIEAMSADARVDLSDLQRKLRKPYSEIAIDEKYLSSDLEPKIRFKTGGEISQMTPSELKAFYNSPEGKKLDAETYAEWKRLVNMTKSELADFYNSEEGLGAGLSRSEASKHGIDSGRESAEWIMKMKDIPYKEWTSDMWRWAKKQISFIKRMSGVKGELYDDKGRKTRKHTALLIWGHNPEKKFKGGGEISQKALAVEITDLKDYVRKYFIKDGRIDVLDAMQELFGNKKGKSIAGEYRKRIGLHKKGGLTISQLSHKLWEEHKDDVRSDINDSDFREAVEEVITSEYGVNSMIKNIMEKSSQGVNDDENEYWMNQYDKSQYEEPLNDEEMNDYFSSLEQSERGEDTESTRKFLSNEVDLKSKKLNQYLKDKKTYIGTVKNEYLKSPEYLKPKKEYDKSFSDYREFNSKNKPTKRKGYNVKSELEKGTEHEMEHLTTLKKVAERKLTPEQAVVETAKTHIAENPEYYEDLAKMEKENENKSIIETQIRGLELLVPMMEGEQKNIIEKQIRGLKLLINIV